MVHVIFLLMFLIDVVIGDWIEVTKVGHSNTKQLVGPKRLLTATPPSYKVTLDRPTSLYEITTIKKSAPIKQNEGEKLIYNNNETKKINLTNSKITHESDEEEILIEDEKINEPNFTQETKDDNISLEDDDDDDESTDEDSDEQNNKRVSVISIIRHVQTQLLDFKGRTLQAKVEHLEKLRDNMIYEIKYQISNMLNPPKENQSESRLFKDESGEYHMEYPSNEGALMTIGLLTFAVFLIKLVLKLIYIFKLKQQNYYPITTTTPVSIFLRKTKREIEQDDKIEESVRILRYLEEYSPS
ncbi:unnamed protein product [Ceutorhynchus assimilis]|uniref:Uncharacterized protein n=1 Tax=Ceutorhynchus assimilis TaxID=467358 RepID=A0A9P0GJP9_9CUCU|nr:unnamed protein product [Ceutorhynchus assimilis]